jgi:hypothetical protein
VLVVFVLVDFYDRGPALVAADEVNGITAVGRRKEPEVASAAAVPERIGWVYGTAWRVLLVVLLSRKGWVKWLW